MEESDDLRVWFRYTGQLKQDRTKAPTGSVLQLDRELVVRIEPSQEAGSLAKVPLSRLLWRAESAFWDEAARLEPRLEVVEWVARVGGRQGRVVSKFTVWWPAQRP